MEKVAEVSLIMIFVEEKNPIKTEWVQKMHQAKMIKRMYLNHKTLHIKFVTVKNVGQRLDVKYASNFLTTFLVKPKKN